MPLATVPDLVQALRAHPVLEPERFEQLVRWSTRFNDPKSLAKDLVQRAWLTPFQVNLLIVGRGAELVLGQYIILERLGEGGMGQVYKARHRAMGRVVALKVVRKELISNANAVKRFNREIQAVSKLHHPNIVLAFDADRVSDTLFFAMEYVEGIDLGRLVKQRGPMPVRDACDAIRQAALGLQHAHERGLVHRDIKPTNLLRSNQGGVVKLLDMGLSRLQEADEDSSQSIDAVVSANLPSMLTQAGKVMGTPDYIAPEQAKNSHTVDVRADLYSLGCTFFFVLTGDVPFPGGTSIEKLFRHQSEMPRSVEKMRPDVPPAVGSIIRKLMAKDARQRFQTPGELAQALTALSAPGGHPVGPLAPGAPATFVANRQVIAALLAQAQGEVPVAQPVGPGGPPLAAQMLAQATPAPVNGGGWSAIDVASEPGPGYRNRRSGSLALLAWAGAIMFLLAIGLFVVSRYGPSLKAALGGTAPPPSTSKGGPATIKKGTPTIPRKAASQ